jgi:TPR repeat protein
MRRDPIHVTIHRRKNRWLTVLTIYTNVLLAEILSRRLSSRDGTKTEMAWHVAMPRHFLGIKRPPSRDTRRRKCSLGRLYEKGWGVSRDYRQAVEWYQKAVQKNDTQAQYNLAWFYNKGYGVERDYTKSFDLYRRSAEQGNTSAQLNLGLMYSFGRGVIKDEKEAVDWYRKAAAQGHAKAQWELGMAYFLGIGTSANKADAYLWMTIAVANGIRKWQRMAFRNLLSLFLTREQKATARKRANEWLESRKRSGASS